MNFYSTIKELLENKHCLYLLSVVESKGSAPGRVGFKMIVSDDGQLFGSIGGGLMEFNLVNHAKGLLKEHQITHSVVHQVHNGSSSATSGMICSGSQRIAFNYFCLDDLPFFNSINQSENCIILSNLGISLNNTINKNGFTQTDDNWSYVELTPQRPVVHVFGAGHVSLPTSQLLTQVGFDVLLYDNRKNLNTFDDNSIVCKKSIVNYQNILKEIEIKPTDFVLLMTHKFTEDKLLLSQFLTISVKYLGVLGSKNKISVMFDALENQGFQKNALDEIHAPVGINIKSQTTDEIAVSIVAEIIKVKNS